MRIVKKRQSSVRRKNSLSEKFRITEIPDEKIFGCMPREFPEILYEMRLIKVTLAVRKGNERSILAGIKIFQNVFETDDLPKLFWCFANQC